MRIVLVLALLASAAVADEDPVAAERAANRALLEKEQARLAKVPKGHFVVVVGGESLTHGPELEPLLEAADKKFAGAVHRFVFRKGDEGPRKVREQPLLRQPLAGAQFFAETKLGLMHTGRNWRVLGPDPDTHAPCPTGRPPGVRAFALGKKLYVELFPAMPLPLVLNEERVHRPRFEIPGYAFIRGLTGLEYGYRRCLAPVEVPELGLTTTVEVWSDRQRWHALQRELQPPTEKVEGNPWQLGKEWAAAALQTRDPQLRARTLEDLRVALRGADPLHIHAALRALIEIRELKFDKEEFRPFILPHLEATSGAIRISAGYALYNTSREPNDLRFFLAMADRPDAATLDSLSHLIFMFSGGDVTGEASDAVMKLFAAAQGRQVREVVRGLWGARVSPEIERVVLEMAQTRGSRHDAIYFGLSTWRDKSRAVVDELLEAVEGSDESASRAMWGLGYGVRPEDHGHVADAFLRLLENRAAPRLQMKCLERIEQYGSGDHVLQLEAWAANEQLAESVRTKAAQVVARLKRKN